MEIFKKLGIQPRDYLLYKQALTHKSYASEHKTGYDYDRLEFVGDAIISKIVAEYLFTRYKDLTEGDMTVAKANMVRSESLARACVESGISEDIKLGKGESLGTLSQNIAEDVFEAFCGALYFDQGEHKVKKLLEMTIIKYYEQAGSTRHEQDDKSRFQQHVQSFTREPVRYKVDQDGIHTGSFTVSVWANDCCYGTGTGKTKKEAEQAAARDALSKLGEAAVKPLK